MAVKLLSEDIFIGGADFHYCLYTAIRQESTVLHCHEFFEFFFVTHGSALHHVNNRVIRLYEGDLVFIRPDDTHAYEKIPGHDMGFINIAFKKELLDEALAFLGSDAFHEILFDRELPPTLKLDGAKKLHYLHMMENLNTILDHQEGLYKRMNIRLLVLEVIAEYCMNTQPARKGSLPGWLSRAMEEMNKKENFVEGLPALKTVAGKSHEHICREFRKHLKTSPTAFINRLRLEYASNLLVYTSKEIVNICFECGFGNLSHFNHQFRAMFGMSPSEYRKSNRRQLVPY